MRNQHDDKVIIHHRDAIAIIEIDNPPVNALSLKVRADLIKTIEMVSKQNSVGAVILTGKGTTFIGGADLRELEGPVLTPTLPDVVLAIESCNKPIVAAISGVALGGGYEIALACDGRVVSPTSSIGLPEGNFGIIPGAGGIERVLRLTDGVTALDIITSCKPIAARDALDRGLVDVVADGDVIDEAIVFATKLRGRKNPLRDRDPISFDAEQFNQAAATALRRGRGRPYVVEQIEAVRRGATETFDKAFSQTRASFLRLRDSTESAALRHLFFAERTAIRLPELELAEARTISMIGIAGAGTMGCGIATAFLAAGIPVTLTDTNSCVLETARERIEPYLSKVKSPGHLTIVTDLAGLGECDLLIEAAFESMEVKTALMAEMTTVARDDAVLASNTSYLNLDVIASATSSPDRVVGLHFFAPANVMRLLEVVRGAHTSPSVLKTALEVGRRLRKVTVVAGVCEGFIGNRIYNAYRTECEEMLMEGALPLDIDTALEALGFAMGPFTVSDLSGLDIAWANRKRRHDAGADKTRDVPVLEWLVAEGRFGRKAGRGWYDYPEGKRVPDASVAHLVEKARSERGKAAREMNPEDIQNRALAAITKESLLVLEDGIARNASDIDLVLVHGYGFPKHLGGPLFWARSQTRAALEELLDAIRSHQPVDMDLLKS